MFWKKDLYGKITQLIPLFQRTYFKFILVNNMHFQNFYAS